MTSITRFAIAHRRLMALIWIVLAVAGGLVTSSATGRLTHSFATPGSPGYDTNQQILERFGIDGNEQPTLAILHLPAAQNMRTPVGRAAAARTFSAAKRAGHLDVVDYARTHNPKLISSDGRTTWALINMPNPDLPIVRWSPSPPPSRSCRSRSRAEQSRDRHGPPSQPADGQDPRVADPGQGRRATACSSSSWCTRPGSPARSPKDRGQEDRAGADRAEAEPAGAAGCDRSR